jgi:hypothetical protein
VTEPVSTTNPVVREAAAGVGAYVTEPNPDEGFEEGW